MQAQTRASDRSLVLLARRGDKRAFCDLLERHRPMLVALCRRMVGNRGLAEDAAQEAYLQALLSLDRLRRLDRFGPWLAGIGLNVCQTKDWIMPPGLFPKSKEILGKCRRSAEG